MSSLSGDNEVSPSRTRARTRCRQTVENLITSNNKNGYLVAAVSQEDAGNGDNGRTNAASVARSSWNYYSRRIYTERAD